MVTSGIIALCCSLGVTTCQWDAGTFVCQFFTGGTLPVADTLTVFIIQVKVGGTLAFTHTITFHTVKEEVAVGTPGLLLAFA